MADRSIEPLDVGVLCRRPGLDEHDPDTLTLGPSLERRAAHLTAVVAPDRRRFTSPLDDPVEASRDALTGQAQIDFDAQTFAVVIVQDVERAERSAVAQTVVHEVDGPHLVNLFRHVQRIRSRALQSPARLDAEVELQLAIDPVDPFLVVREALHVA